MAIFANVTLMPALFVNQTRLVEFTSLVTNRDLSALVQPRSTEAAKLGHVSKGGQNAHDQADWSSSIISVPNFPSAPSSADEMLTQSATSADEMSTHTASTQTNATLQSTQARAMLWHWRLGGAGVEALQTLTKSHPKVMKLPEKNALPCGLPLLC